MQNKDLSVIIPALNEEKTLRGCLDSVKKLDPLEVIVVDGGSADRTKEIAADNGAFVIESRRGRGVQMNAGASIAKGKVLLFLHADTQMPEMKKSFASAAPNSYAGGFFHLKFDDDSMSTKLVEAFANMRARLSSRITDGFEIIRHADIKVKEIMPEVGVGLLIGFVETHAHWRIELKRLLHRTPSRSTNLHEYDLISSTLCHSE